MKTSTFAVLFTILTLIMTSCEKDFSPLDTIYTNFQVSFVSGYSEVEKITYDGHDVVGSNIYIKNQSENGKLEIYGKDNALLFSKVISVKGGDDIRLIYYGNKFELFSEDVFNVCYLKFITLSGLKAADYTFQVDGVNLNPDGTSKNYIKKSNDGSILSVKNKKGEEVVRDTLSITPNGTIFIWEQNSKFKVLQGTSDVNPPTVPNLGKASFIFTDAQNLLPNIDSVKVEIYAFKDKTYTIDTESLEKFAELTLKKNGDMSKYYEFNLTKFGDEYPTAYTVCFYDAKDGTLIFDGRNNATGRVRFKVQSNKKEFVYKYQTMELKLIGKYAVNLPLFWSDPWETTNQ